jgi:hypothetical protein
MRLPLNVKVASAYKSMHRRFRFESRPRAILPTNKLSRNTYARRNCHTAFLSRDRRPNFLTPIVSEQVAGLPQTPGFDIVNQSKVRPARLERATFCFVGKRSIRLSYGRS